VRSTKPERRKIDRHDFPVFCRGFLNKASTALLMATLLLFAADSFAAKAYTIAVIGTGNMGSALGKKLAGAGHRVVYGTRDPSRAEVNVLLGATGHGATATTQRKAAQQGDIVILAVPWAPMKGVVKNLGDLSGKILIDISGNARQAKDGYLELSADLSSSEMIQQWAAGARVVKTAFSAAEIIEDPLKYGEPTLTYIASDDRSAKETVAELTIQLSLFPLDAGPLRMGKSIDHMGLLYLTPLVQARDMTWVWVPRVAADYSCISTEGWFDPVNDANDLASFPNLEARDRQCPPKSSTNRVPE
jgi:predicted dinucleotide-binding enzyme